jgi:hypothetical protein
MGKVYFPRLKRKTGGVKEGGRAILLLSSWLAKVIQTKVTVNNPLYRPGEALRFPGG